MRVAVTLARGVVLQHPPDHGVASRPKLLELRPAQAISDAHEAVAVKEPRCLLGEARLRRVDDLQLLPEPRLAFELVAERSAVRLFWDAEAARIAADDIAEGGVPADCSERAGPWRNDSLMELPSPRAICELPPGVTPACGCGAGAPPPYPPGAPPP